MDRGRDGTTTTEDKSGNVKVPLLTVPIDCPPTPRVFLSSWDRGKKICDYTIVQDDTSVMSCVSLSSNPALSVSK